MGAAGSSLSAQQIDDENVASYKAHPRLSAVVTGGTSGIGEAISLKLASLVDQPHIIIVGRSQASADRVLARLREVNSSGRYEFVSSDLTLMKNVDAAAKEVLSRMPRVNILVLSSGFLRLDGKRVDTSEGIDESMAVQFYSRFLLIRRLMPALEAAAAAQEPAHAMFILNCGKASSLPHADNMDFKKRWSGIGAGLAVLTYTDLMTEELSSQHPTVTLSHAFPGMVATPISKDLPLWAKMLFLPTTPFQITPERCASTLCHALARAFSKPGGWYFFNQHAGPVPPSKHQTPEARAAVWDHATKLTDQAAGGGTIG